MSTESLAFLRRTQNQELAELAEKHFKNDLTENDRVKLKSAASTVSTATMIGTLAGLSLGAFLAFRIRANRQRMFQAFRTSEKPTHIKFANGREEAIPDITPLLKPTTLGDFATYTFFAAGGIFFGGELGLLIGGATAKRSITSDPETRQRVEKAFRLFRADVMRKEIEQLEKGERRWVVLDQEFLTPISSGIKLLGFDLTRPESTDSALQNDDIPSLSVEDTTARLNGGQFKLLFNIFKEHQDHYFLTTLTVPSMRVGARITRAQLNYVLSVYKDEQAWAHLPESQEQIRVACHEYKSGTPYNLRNFDFDNEVEESVDRAESLGSKEIKESTAAPAAPPPAKATAVRKSTATKHSADMSGDDEHQTGPPKKKAKAAAKPRPQPKRNKKIRTSKA